MSSPRVEDYMGALSDAKKTPTSDEFPFNLISKKISILRDFCKVLDNHPEELEESYRIACEKTGLRPSGYLEDYLVLNIALFYDCAKRRFKLENKEMPGTYSEVMRFRSNVMAHFGDKIHTNAELVKEYNLINGIDGKNPERIWKDYFEFRDKIFDKLKQEIKNE